MAVSRRSARPRFTLLVLVLASLSFVTLDSRGGGLVSGLRGRARDSFGPVQSAVGGLTQPVSDFLRGTFEYRRLSDANARLRADNDKLRTQQIQSAYLAQTNKDLNDLLKLDFSGDIPTIAARVLAGPGSNFQRTMVIDRGSAAGILKGMPVIAGAGLLGRVVDVSGRQSTVLLLDDASASVGIQFAPSTAVGVATGQGTGRRLSVTLVDPATPVAAGTVAVTSGLAGSPFPRGIPVGRVSTAGPKGGGSARSLSLAPVVDLSQVSYVDVLVWTAQTPGNVAGAGPAVGGISTPPPPTTTPTTVTIPGVGLSLVLPPSAYATTVPAPPASLSPASGSPSGGSTSGGSTSSNATAPPPPRPQTTAVPTTGPPTTTPPAVAPTTVPVPSTPGSTTAPGARP